MDNILIVVDIQNDFVDGSLGTPEAQAIIPNAVKRIKEHKGRIFVTLDTHDEDYLISSEGKNLPIPHCIKGTDGHELYEDIKAALDGRKYTVIEKPTFGSLDLAEVILDSEEDDIRIELIGLCTDICVISNALILKACLPENQICVKEDCCAGVTPEKHKAAIEVMRSCQIEII